MGWFVAAITVLTVSGALSMFADPALAVQRPDSTSEKEAPLPLEIARTIHYDMTEGSWISLDVSPDGQTIVFDVYGRSVHASDRWG